MGGRSASLAGGGVARAGMSLGRSASVLAKGERFVPRPAVISNEALRSWPERESASFPPGFKSSAPRCNEALRFWGRWLEIEALPVGIPVPHEALRFIRGIQRVSASRGERFGPALSPAGRAGLEKEGSVAGQAGQFPAGAYLHIEAVPGAGQAVAVAQGSVGNHQGIVATEGQRRKKDPAV